jgi:hypothetical protein
VHKRYVPLPLPHCQVSADKYPQLNKALALFFKAPMRWTWHCLSRPFPPCRSVCRPACESSLPTTKCDDTPPRRPRKYRCKGLRIFYENTTHTHTQYHHCTTAHPIIWQASPPLSSNHHSFKCTHIHTHRRPRPRLCCRTPFDSESCGTRSAKFPATTSYTHTHIHARSKEPRCFL